MKQIVHLYENSLTQVLSTIGKTTTLLLILLISVTSFGFAETPTPPPSLALAPAETSGPRFRLGLSTMQASGNVFINSTTESKGGTMAGNAPFLIYITDLGITVGAQMINYAIKVENASSNLHIDAVTVGTRFSTTLGEYAAELFPQILYGSGNLAGEIANASGLEVPLLIDLTEKYPHLIAGIKLSFISFGAGTSTQISQNAKGYGLMVGGMW